MVVLLKEARDFLNFGRRLGYLEALCQHTLHVIAFLSVVFFLLLRTSRKPSRVTMANLNKSKYDTDEDFPIAEGNQTFMAKNLTKEMYRKLRDVHTPSGFTIDLCIQNGVDNPGRLRLL